MRACKGGLRTDPCGTNAWISLPDLLDNQKPNQLNQLSHEAFELEWLECHNQSTASKEEVRSSKTKTETPWVTVDL